MVQRESAIRMVKTTVYKKLWDHFKAMNPSRRQEFQKVIERRNNPFRLDRTRAQNVDYEVRSFLNNLSSRVTDEIEHKHLIGPNVMEGDVVHAWNQEATENAKKEIEDMIKNESTRSSLRPAYTNRPLSPNPTIGSLGTAQGTTNQKTKQGDTPRLLRPGAKRARTISHEPSGATSTPSRYQVVKLAEKQPSTVPSLRKNFGSSGGVKQGRKGQSSMGASPSTSPLSPLTVNGSQGQTDQEKEQDLSGRTSKYVCFLHGEIATAAEENGCTGFISILDLMKLAAHIFIIQRVDVKSMTDRQYNKFSRTLCEMCESLTPADAGCTLGLAKSMLAEAMGCNLTEKQEARWNANWEALGMNSADAAPRNLPPEEEICPCCQPEHGNGKGDQPGSCSQDDNGNTNTTERIDKSASDLHSREPISTVEANGGDRPTAVVEPQGSDAEIFNRPTPMNWSSAPSGAQEDPLTNREPQSSFPAAASTLPHLGYDNDNKDEELLTAGQLSIGWSSEGMQCTIKTEV